MGRETPGPFRSDTCAICIKPTQHINVISLPFLSSWDSKPHTWGFQTVYHLGANQWFPNLSGSHTKNLVRPKIVASKTLQDPSRDPRWCHPNLMRYKMMIPGRAGRRSGRRHLTTTLGLRHCGTQFGNHWVTTLVIINSSYMADGRV